jgi:DNA topoisomerase-3
MPKTLVIAEKPSVAQDLARALGKIPRKGDHFENDHYVIASAVGHVVELEMPEDIDKKKYGFWRLEMLPIIPEKFGLKPIADSKDRYNQLKKLLHRKDIDLVINACDAGREGELIFQNLYQLSKSKLPVKRAWMQTMTTEGIREAFRTLRSGEEMAGLADAARSRSESDWLIGINGTRAITKRFYGSRGGNVATVGRVQTPTLAIVFNRELEIRNFQPRDYWRVTAKFQIAQGTYEGVYQRPDFRKNEKDEHDRVDRIWDKAVAEAVVGACEGLPRAQVSEEKKSSTQASPRLYDLTTLQREVNNRFSLSARRILQIAQALYERHKVITYPRTDSRALPEDYLATCRQTLGNLTGDLAQHGRIALEKGWVRPNKRIFNNAQISDHFAIIPTGAEPKQLDEMEAKVYDMIARRFVAAFFPAAEFDVTTRISQVAAKHNFKTEGKVLTSPGWLAVYGRTTVDDAAESKALPALTNTDNREAKTLSAQLHAEVTKPPPRYTEATLLSAMERAGKMVDDEELAEAMKERGLGTPATRADIIDGLLNQKYLERHQRDLVPTTKAESLIEFLSAVHADSLTKPDMTGEWEFKLREMEHGKFPRREFMSEIVEVTKRLVARTREFEEDEFSRETDIISPTDRKPMIETLRTYKSQDGALVVYKVMSGRKMDVSEVRELVNKGEIGPLDGFVSAKTGKRFPSKVKIVNDEKNHGRKKAELDFGTKVDLNVLAPFWTDPKTGAQLCEAPTNYVLRQRDGDGWTETFKVGRMMCQKAITREQAIQLVTDGKTELIEKFTSKKGRPFDAYLVRQGARVTWEFPPRKPREGAAKNGKSAPRKPKPPVDLAQAVRLGESKLHGGDLYQTEDAFVVAKRQPNESPRVVFQMKRNLCGKEISAEEAERLVELGKTNLIEGFVSKRGSNFSAYLTLSKDKKKAEFEFPPR